MDGRLSIRFPSVEARLDQDEEWCEVEVNGDWRRIRFHDYHEIFAIPGLYELLFYRILKCCSPQRVVGLLESVVVDNGESLEGLNMLDVGAGNGMVGRELVNHGVKRVIGVDIIPEARDATWRDLPWVYEDYLVADLCGLAEGQEERLRKARFNGLTSVAALGYGDIPPRAFAKALDMVSVPGWLAFNIKDDFLNDTDTTGFSALIRQLREQRVIRVEAYQRYQHRLSIEGEPLYYTAMIARKLKDVPDAFLN